MPVYTLEFVRYQPPQTDTSGLDANAMLPGYVDKVFASELDARTWIQENTVKNPEGLIALFRIVPQYGVMVGV